MQVCGGPSLRANGSVFGRRLKFASGVKMPAPAYRVDNRSDLFDVFSTVRNHGNAARLVGIVNGVHPQLAYKGDAEVGDFQQVANFYC